MAKLIGTAGHVDHGKTSLIQALTGIDADRLPEEKARGLTIDIGFAYIELPGHGRVSIVDVPGHEKFITNMLVGAQGVAVALLCVSADAGVMPQTREHVQILDLLPVEALVVALTRCDLVDGETLELAKLDIVDYLASTRFANAPVIATSAHVGTGLEELKTALSTALEGASQPAESGLWYLPIDRAFVIKGHGLVVTGTLAGGAVKSGDRAFIQPSGEEARVRSIQSHEESVELGEPGRRTALNLTGAKAEDVHRGQAVGAPGALFRTDVLDLQVRWVEKPKHGVRVRFAIGAEEAIGKVFLNDTDESVVQVRLETPIAAALNQPAIIRLYSPPRLLGGGKVVVPQATVRRKSEATVILTAQSDEDRILDLLTSKPLGLDTDRVCRSLGRTPQTLGDLFERMLKQGKVRGFAGLWFTQEDFAKAVATFEDALHRIHLANPTVAYVPKEAVVETVKFPWTGKPLDRIVSALVDEARLVAYGGLIRLPTHQVQLTDRQSEFLRRVTTELEASGVNTPNPHELSKILPAPIQAVEEIMRLGVESGVLTRVEEGIFYTTKQLEEIKAKLLERFGDRAFAASEFRDGVETSRKYAIPLLEYFDRVRFTLRTGDQRVIRKSS